LCVCVCVSGSILYCQFRDNFKGIALDMLHALFEDPSWYADLLGDWRTNTEMYLKRRAVGDQNLTANRFDRSTYFCALPGDTNNL